MNELIHNEQRSQIRSAAYEKENQENPTKASDLVPIQTFRRSVKIPRKILDFRRFHFHLISYENNW